MWTETSWTSYVRSCYYRCGCQRQWTIKIWKYSSPYSFESGTQFHNNHFFTEMSVGLLVLNLWNRWHEHIIIIFAMNNNNLDIGNFFLLSGICMVQSNCKDSQDMTYVGYRRRTILGICANLGIYTVLYTHIFIYLYNNNNNIALWSGMTNAVLQVSGPF